MAPTEIRRRRLTALVAERGFVRVVDASAELEVSEVTVRSDLRALEASGVLVRVHGGAMPRGTDRESSFEQSLEQAAAAKRAIGRRAAALVSNGESVILDVGSTALAVAEALIERRDLSELIVITNGLSIALALEAAMPRFTVIVTGGTLRPLQHSLVNPLAQTLLDSLHADIAFIGCNGVDLEAGVTNVNLPEAEVKSRMLGAATRHVAIADGTKLGRVHLGAVGAIEEFDVLITGEDAPAEIVSGLRRRGLIVELAG